MIVFDGGNDLFAIDADVLVNPVNTVGVMGAGLALEFKKRYPQVYEQYRAACKLGNVKLGRIYVLRDGATLIAHLPTKRHWRDVSTLGDVGDGLADLAVFLRQLARQEQSKRLVVGLPAVGCGLGGLAWPDVRKVTEDTFHGVECDIHVFAPQ